MALGGLHAVNGQEWVKVLIGLVVSTLMGFIGGFIITKLIVWLFRELLVVKQIKFYDRASGRSWSKRFLHGAQDGQKFMGVFMLGLYFNNLVEKAATALRSLCG